MKKIIITLLLTAITVFAAKSGKLLLIEGGAGAWLQSPSGEISYTSKLTGIKAVDKSTKQDNTQTYAWVYIKHFVPIIPNFRFEYVDVENDGVANGKFKEYETVGLGANTNLKMKQYDIIPYYNLLDNTFWMTLDLGIDIKIADISYEADAVNLVTLGVTHPTLTSYTESETLILPLIYVRGRVDVPKTNFGVEADVKYITYGDHTVYDARVKIDYIFNSIPVIQPAIEVGYRIQKFDIKDDGAKVDLEFSGMYVGAYLRF